jgi:hypothetical protein
MTSKEFVLWLKGFTEGVHEFNITPKQWDNLKEKLAEVNDGTPIGEGGWGTPNGTKIITTPGTTGFIKITNPHTGLFNTTGSATYNPSTSTTYGYPSGSAWHYTNS